MREKSRSPAPKEIGTKKVNMPTCSYRIGVSRIVILRCRMGWFILRSVAVLAFKIGRMKKNTMRVLTLP